MVLYISLMTVSYPSDARNRFIQALSKADMTITKTSKKIFGYRYGNTLHVYIGSLEVPPHDTIPATRVASIDWSDQELGNFMSARWYVTPLLVNNATGPLHLDQTERIHLSTPTNTGSFVADLHNVHVCFVPCHDVSIPRKRHTKALNIGGNLGTLGKHFKEDGGVHHGWSPNYTALQVEDGRGHLTRHGRSFQIVYWERGFHGVEDGFCVILVPGRKE